MGKTFPAPTFLESMAKEILAKYRRLDSLLSHAPTKGTYHENILRSFIDDFLPSTYSVGEGFFINEKGEVSTQTDILIVDNIDPRSFGFRSDNFFIASDLAVCCFAEVKTKPNHKDFLEAFKKVVKDSSLIPDAGRVTNFIFLYEGPARHSTFAKWIEEAVLQANKDGFPYFNYPDYIFCFQSGWIATRVTLPDEKFKYQISAPKPNDSNSMDYQQQAIISNMYACIINGCGRLRNSQDITLLR